MAEERIRQNKFEAEAQGLNTQSQDRYQDFSGQQDQKATELGQYFSDQHIDDANANNAATQEMTTPQSGSNVVVQEEAKQRAKARDFTNQQGEALGELRSFGDLMGGIGRSQARDAGQIGQIGGFMKGSSNVLPFELEAANGAGNGAKTFGDILGLAGSVSLGKGLGSGAKGASTVAKAGVDPWAGMRSVTKTNLYDMFRGA